MGEFSDSFIVLGVFNDVVVANRRNFLKPDVLVTGKLGKTNEIGSIEWNEVTPRNRIPELENHVYHYINLVQEADIVSKC